MTKIQQLPPKLVAKIAAGEVIERPAYVVKEVVENALDAQATNILIEIEKGGLESITITDNGEGMSAEDLLLSWQQHTTSKLPPDSDLTLIEHLGFRGEALSSIAAVSNLTLQSRQQMYPHGNMIRVQNGELRESKVCAMAPGTIVHVEQLFAGLPGRQKFLRSAQTEWLHILRIIEGLALASPHVHFTLLHNKKTIFDAPIQTMIERLSAVLGPQVAAESFTFQLSDPYAQIDGFLGTPQLSFQTNLPSFFIVNGRVARNATLLRAIKESYRGLLKVEATPFFLLNISVPLQTIDVNIHPRKEEISFVHERELAATLKENIQSTARNQELSYQWRTPKADTKSTAAQNLRNDILERLRSHSPQTPIMQLHNLYLVVPTPEGFLLVDQHAAHERILYNELQSLYAEKSAQQESIVLENPPSFSLPLSQKEFLESSLLDLEKLGFSLQKTTENTYQLIRAPELLAERSPLQLFQELLCDLESGKKTTIDQHTNRTLAFLACRLAIKAGDPLTQEQMQKLVQDLGNTPSGYTCPHGRPTHIVFTLNELEKTFGRKE